MTTKPPPEPSGARRGHEIVGAAPRERAARAWGFAAYLEERLIDSQHRQRVWITSATEVGRMLGVCDVSAVLLAARQVAATS